MTENSIGQFTLSVSFVLYCLYFVPQIIHNQKSTNRSELSIGLHLLYIMGYCLDWVYGMGQHLPWQYRTVTAIGLAMLLVQQYQLRPQNSASNAENRQYYLLTGLIITLYALALSAHTFTHYLTTSRFNYIGLLSVTCLICTFLPQFWKNYQTKTGHALSKTFVILTLIISILDLISAVTLHWPWPSIASPTGLFLMHLVYFFQQNHYLKRAKHGQMLE